MHAQRVVVVTDGVITAGAEHAELAAVAKAIGAERVDVVLSGGIRDDGAAGELVRTGKAHAGAVLDLDDGDAVVAEQLSQPVRVDVPIEIPGATWVYPRTIATARAGTSTMVFAELAQPQQTLEVVVGGEHRNVPMLAAEQPLVERAIGGAEIRELEAKLASAPADKRAGLRQLIAQKSVENRVISSETSLLVLETPADYARYGIEQRSLADVLVVGPHGLVRHHRDAPSLQIASPPPEEPRKRMIGGQSEDKDDGDGHFKTVEREKLAVENFTATTTDRRAALDEAQVAGVLGGEATKSPSTGRDEDRPSMGMGDGVAAASGGMAEDAPPSEQESPWPPKNSPVALTGELATIEAAVHGKHIDQALTRARAWHAKEPGNVLALIGLGDALEASNAPAMAARIYGSIIDLFPGRADMRRFAGERLARIQQSDLIIDTYRRAVLDRPDHMTGHRLLAYALVRAHRPAEAFAAVLDALDQPYRNDSYAGGMRTLGDDAGMIGASWIASDPTKRKEVEAALAKRDLKLPTSASTRFILYWETDANDVDFHIQDARGGHAFYGAKTLRSGGELYADITTGYGPECFAIQGTPKAGPYRLSINYYSQGPMGYGMGLLEIQKFDGKGGLAFEDRPYVIMNDQAYVDLGTF